MLETILSWLGQSGLLPHGYCIKWSLPLLSTYVISDGLIALSYFAIPAALTYFASQRKDLSVHRKTLRLFAAFIIACGTTHLVSIVLFWQPLYWLDAGLKALTALISVIAVTHLFPQIPALLRLPNPEQLLKLNQELQQEIELRKQTEAALRQEKQLTDDIINSLSGIFYILNDHGNLVRWNSKLLGTTGYGAEEVYNRHALNFIAAADHALITEKIQEGFEKGSATAEAALLAKNGELMPYYFSCSRVKLDSHAYLIGLGLDFSEHKRIEAVLRQSELKFRTLFESSRDAIMVLNLEGIFIDGNPAAIAMFGYRNEQEFFGASPASTSPEFQPDGRRSSEKQAELMGQIMTEGSLFFEWLHCRNDGSEFIAEVLVMRIELGEQTLLQAVVRDISERKQLEKTLREKERALSESQRMAHIGSWVVDLASGYISWTEECDKIFGVTNETFAHSVPALIELMHPDDRILMENWVHACVAGEQPGPLDFRIILADGSIRYICGSGGLQCDEMNHPLRILGIAQDISERKQAEEMLKKAKALAEETARTKSNFLANMSHEIRTPMNAVLGFAQLALNLNISPQVRNYLDKIIAASHSLLQIINDILDLSKSEAGRMTLENAAFNLDSLLNALHSLFSARAKQKELNLEFIVKPNVPKELIGDKYRLQQILSNLLSNAIKFTPHGSVTLKIQLKQHNESTTRLSFRVEDTGIGMTAAECAQLFQPFSQADSSISRRFGGTGLGLVISRNLLRLMGGEFRVESTPGMGSIFSFELTFDLASHALHEDATWETGYKGATQHAGCLTQINGKLAGTRILVAEDNVTNQQVVAEFLQLSGAEVICVDNGLAALEQLEKNRFDAILMDVHMPNMDGITATQRIRQHERYADLPVIALTAGVTAEERENCLSCGMNDFIAKPIIPEQLIATLSRRLNLKPDLDNPAPRDQADASFLSQLSGFDLHPLLNMFGARPDKLIAILCRFRDDFSTVNSDIDTLFETGDMEAVRATLHTLKGAAGNVGATALHAVAAKLESELVSAQFNPLTLSLFRKTVNETLSSLALLRKPATPGIGQTPTPHALNEAIEQVFLLLSTNTFIEDDILDRISLLIQPEQMPLFIKLRDQINCIRYVEAKATLEQLKS